MTLKQMIDGLLVDMTPEEEAAFLAAQAAVAPTFNDRAAALQTLVQGHMDARARSLGYDNLAVAVTYADEPAVPKFQAEGQAFRAWRSLVWAFCYHLLDDVSAGREPEPSADDLLAALPPLGLPA